MWSVRNDASDTAWTFSYFRDKPSHSNGDRKRPGCRGRSEEHSPSHRSWDRKVVPQSGHRTALHTGHVFSWWSEGDIHPHFTSAHVANMASCPTAVPHHAARCGPQPQEPWLPASCHKWNTDRTIIHPAYLCQILWRRSSSGPTGFWTGSLSTQGAPGGSRMCGGWGTQHWVLWWDCFHSSLITPLLFFLGYE